MIEDAINELFQTIEETKEYKDYLQSKKELKEDKEIQSLIEEIKSLQKKATYLEYHHDNKYKDLDQITQTKLTTLNNNPKYQNYLNSASSFHRILEVSSSIIEDYINSKFSI